MFCDDRALRTKRTRIMRWMDSSMRCREIESSVINVQIQIEWKRNNRSSTEWTSTISWHGIPISFYRFVQNFLNSFLHARREKKNYFTKNSNPFRYNYIQRKRKRRKKNAMWIQNVDVPPWILLVKLKVLSQFSTIVICRRNS